jgi:hypothetical protein
VGFGHDLIHFAVDGGASGNRLCERREVKVERSYKYYQRLKSIYSRFHGTPSIPQFRILPDDLLRIRVILIMVGSTLSSINLSFRDGCREAQNQTELQPTTSGF